MNFPLPETITVWSELSNDGFGGKTWSRNEYPSRHSMKAEQFRNANGEISISKAVVYTNTQSIKVGDFVYLGASTSTTPIQSAEEIRGFSSNVSSINLSKVWL